MLREVPAEYAEIRPRKRKRVGLALPGCVDACARRDETAARMGIPDPSK